MAISFDTTIHLGDLVMAGVGLLLTGVSWLTRRAFKRLTNFFTRIEGFDQRIESTAETVDLHSDLFVTANLARPEMFSRVSHHRRTSDLDPEQSVT